jgi:proline iminopeptidase
MKKILFSSYLILAAILLVNCGTSEVKTDEAIEDNIENEAPLATTSETVEINGVKHFIEKMGSGEPLLVVHGGPGIFHDYLVPHFQTLAKKYEVIFYDQRGCGKTAFPKDTSSINIETFVEDLEGIRQHLKIDKLNLIGHSWGSLLSINYAKKYPNNLKRLILVSPTPANTDFFNKTFTNMQSKRTEEDTKELIHTMMSKEFEQREEVAFRKAILLGDKVNLADQASVEELYKPMAFNKETANSLIIVNSLMERTYFNFDVTQNLDLITCPTLIVLGDLDNVPFASAQAIQDRIKGAQLVTIQTTCHYPFFEDPKEFNHAIKSFLDPEYIQ